MKNYIFTFALLAAITVISACSKDQKVVKELEGTWTVTATTVDGVAQPDSTFSGTTYTFNKCKVKKENCNGTLEADLGIFGSLSFGFQYNIADKGETFNMIVLGETTSSTIVEHSDSKFVFSTSDTSGVIETTLTK